MIVMFPKSALWVCNPKMKFKLDAIMAHVRVVRAVNFTPSAGDRVRAAVVRFIQFLFVYFFLLPVSVFVSSYLNSRGVSSAHNKFRALSR